MSLWSNTDNANGKPAFANTATVFGVDVAEAALQNFVASPGWVDVQVGHGPIVSIAVTTPGTGYVDNEALIFASGGGNGAAGFVTTSGNSLVANVTINGGGVGYANAAALIFDPVGAQGTVTTDSNGMITAVTITTGGAYATAPTVTIDTVAGTNANLTVEVGDLTPIGDIVSATLTNGGSGYTSAPTVTIDTIVGVNGALTAAVGGRAGRITSETLVAMKSIGGDAEDTQFPDA